MSKKDGSPIRACSNLSGNCPKIFDHLMGCIDLPPSHTQCFAPQAEEHKNMQQRLREPSQNIFIPGTKILRPVIDVVSKRLLEHNKEAL
ncbi:hypothetical protein EBR21_17225, partial [bacterium]|nr:hypothetical protein [bacterium]